MGVGVVCPGVEGGSGKSFVISFSFSSSTSLYIDNVELIEGCIDAILNRACTSSSVASPSSAASNDANARSLLDTEEPDRDATWVANAGRGGGSGALGEGVFGDVELMMTEGTDVVIVERVMGAGESVSEVDAGAGGTGACSSSNGSIALPLPLSSFGTGTYTDEASLRGLEAFDAFDAIEFDLDRRLGTSS